MTLWCLQPALGTDTGKRRKNNEDAISYHYPEDAQTLQDYGAIFVIADGVGGLRGSQRASYIAVNMIVHQYYNSIASTIEERLRDVIRQANRMIIDQSEQSKNATTIVIAVFHKKDVIIAHAGDSRAYWVTRSEIRQLTKDHTVKIHLSDGQIKERLNEAIGHRPQIKPDVIRMHAALHGNLLMVTDGVTRYLNDSELKRIVGGYEPDAAVSEIISRANEAGGVDNISAIVVNVMADCEDTSKGAQHAAAINRDIPLLGDYHQSAAFVMVRRAAPVTKRSTFAMSTRFVTKQISGDHSPAVIIAGILAVVIVVGLIYAVVAFGLRG